jgi:hypothetical protein
MPSDITGWTAVICVCLSNVVPKSGQYLEIILPNVKRGSLKLFIASSFAEDRMFSKILFCSNLAILL